MRGVHLSLLIAKFKAYYFIFILCIFITPESIRSQETEKTFEINKESKNSAARLMAEKYRNRKHFFTTSYLFTADPSQSLSDSQGKISVFRHRFDWSFIYLINKKIIPGFSFNYEHSNYDLSEISGTLGLRDAVMDQGMRLRFGPSLLIKISDHWSTFFAFYPNFSLEYGANWGNSFRYSSIAFASYRFNPKISLRFGVLVIGSRPESGTLVIPIIGFEWKPNKKWETAIGGITDGPGIYVTYQVHKKIKLKLDASWVLHEFRLNNDGAIPKGVLEDMKVPIRLGMIYEPWTFISINPFVGSNVWSRYRIRNAQGEKVQTVYGKPSFTTGIGINVKY